MRNTIILIASIFLMYMMFSSCQDQFNLDDINVDFPSNELNQTMDLSQDGCYEEYPIYLFDIYDNLGEFHNDVLDSIYYLIDSKGVDSINFSEPYVYNLIYHEIKDYLINISSLDSFVMYNDELIDSELEFSNIIYSVDSTIVISEVFDSLSVGLRSIILDNNHDASSQIDILFYNNVFKIEDCLERLAFASMCSVGKSSLEYWNNNYDKWLELTDYSSFRASDPASIAYADAVGSAAGALYGLKVGLVGGTVAIPGLGTAVGGAGGVMVGMISGAIGSSVKAGIVHIIRSWW